MQPSQTSQHERGVFPIPDEETKGRIIGKDNCLFTDCMAKAKYASDQGVHIDVWIDDLPSNVDHNKKLFTDFKNSSFPY